MNPDHEHMINWYSGWKCLMPARIVEHPTIKDRFHSALDIICQPMRWSSLYTLSTTIYVNSLYYKMDKQLFSYYLLSLQF